MLSRLSSRKELDSKETRETNSLIKETHMDSDSDNDEIIRQRKRPRFLQPEKTPSIPPFEPLSLPSVLSAPSVSFSLGTPPNEQALKPHSAPARSLLAYADDQFADSLGNLGFSHSPRGSLFDRLRKMSAGSASDVSLDEANNSVKKKTQERSPKGKHEHFSL